MNFKQKIMGITFPLTLFLYLSICLFGTRFGLDSIIWAQALPVFLLIPAMPFILGIWKFKFTVPVVILILYLLIGFISTSLGEPLWHPAWVIFLLIPVFEVLLKPTKKDVKFKFNFTTSDKEDEE